MPARGRKPKPNEQKELAGNPGGRDLPNVPEPPKGMPPMPKEFLSEHGQRAYLWIKAQLDPTGILTGADFHALTAMCMHWAYAAEANQVLRKQGVTLIDKDGVRRKNPANQIFRDNMKSFRMFAENFGMTPSSRSRIEMPASAQDDIASYLFGADVAPGDETDLADVVGANPAKALKEAGFYSLEFARTAAEEGYDLTEIKGVGPATVRKLKGD